MKDATLYLSDLSVLGINVPAEPTSLLALAKIYRRARSAQYIEDILKHKTLPTVSIVAGGSGWSETKIKKIKKVNTVIFSKTFTDSQKILSRYATSKSTPRSAFSK